MKQCETCYWRLSGCVPDEGQVTCWDYYPLDSDCIVPEAEYDPGPDADAWGQAGFEVFNSAQEMAEYFERDDV